MNTVIPEFRDSGLSGTQGPDPYLALSLSKGGPRMKPCFDKLSTGMEFAAPGSGIFAFGEFRHDKS